MNFNDIARRLDQWVEVDAVPGVSIAIQHRDEPLLIHTAGMAALDRPMTPDTLFALASVSKPFTVAGFMKAVDDGLIGLDDAVVDVVHDFGTDIDPFDPDLKPPLEAQRDDITWRQMLSHMSGLPELLSVKRMRATSLPSLDEQVDEMMRLPLVSAPGDVLRYSNVDIAIAARAIEKVTNTPIHTWINRQIIEPMSIPEVELTPGPEFDNQIAIVRNPANEGTSAESYNSRYWRDQGNTWGGYFGSPRGVLDFAMRFLPGRPNVLSEESVREMTTDQVNGADGGVESLNALWSPGFWGIGWEVKGTKPRHWTGSKSSPETFCHWGQAGTLTWVDPTRELGVSVFANATVRDMWPFKKNRWAYLNDDIIDMFDESEGITLG